MAFRKIKETIQAFRGAPPSLGEQLDLYEQELRARVFDRDKGKEKPNLAVILIALFIVVLPLASFLAGVAHSFLKVDEKITAIIISVSVTYILDSARDRIMAAIPFQKLNPYFGSKIEETIGAFRVKKDRG